MTCPEAISWWLLQFGQGLAPPQLLRLPQRRRVPALPPDRRQLLKPDSIHIGVFNQQAVAGGEPPEALATDRPTHPLWLVGPPRLTVDGHFRQHRDELAALAADYRNGSIDAPVALPPWLRPLSIDGRAHPRCGGQRDCALYLPMWQNFRAEQGTGIAYYPAPPGRDASLATAAGDVGTPVRELGDGGG